MLVRALLPVAQPAAVLRVLERVRQRAQPVLDELPAPRLPQQLAEREHVRHARRDPERGAARRVRHAVVVEPREPALHARTAREADQPRGLVGEPGRAFEHPDMLAYAASRASRAAGVSGGRRGSPGRTRCRARAASRPERASRRPRPRPRAPAPWPIAPLTAASGSRAPAELEPVEREHAERPQLAQCLQRPLRVAVQDRLREA